jgi:hypothetical protein
MSTKKESICVEAKFWVVCGHASVPCIIWALGMVGAHGMHCHITPDVFGILTVQTPPPNLAVL